MFARPSFPLVAVDVGNSRIKLGLFVRSAENGLPMPEQTLTVGPDWSDSEISQWLTPNANHARWLIASVERSAGARMLEFAAAAGGEARLLSLGDLRLRILAEPAEAVGMDRLANAVAANRLRSAGRPAIVVDVGSAITVDVVDSTGAFLGGAILPGIAMAAKALDQFTDLLPLVPVSQLGEAPDPLGRSTIPAIQAGLFWGAVGGIRELVARHSERFSDAEVFLTGGAAPSVAALITDAGGRRAQYIPHLTLGGIALSAEK